ncbi:MAG: hypothetical protein WCL49_13455, partial [bacterium]
MRLILFILAGWILMLPPEGRAGTIQLQPEARVEITNGLPVAVIEVFNGGNEPARMTRLEVGLSPGGDSGTLAAPATRTLSRTVAPGTCIQEQLSISPPPARPGVYQMVTRIRYSDFTGGEFSSVSVSGFSWGGTNQADHVNWVVPSVAQVSLGRTGVLRVSL